VRDKNRENPSPVLDFSQTFMRVRNKRYPPQLCWLTSRQKFMSRSLIFLFLFSAVFTPALADGFSKALRQVNEGNYRDAKSALLKLVEKTPEDFAVNFLFARYYYQEDNPAHRLDSAYYFSTRAIKFYPGSAAEVTRTKYAAAGIRPYSLNRLRADICQLAFLATDSVNTLEKWEAYIQTFIASRQMPEAIERRNQLAYEQAKGASNYESFKDFMERYPNAEQTVEAKKLYESLLYKKKTEPNTWQAYKLFMDENPNSPYLKEAKEKYHQLFFKDVTKDRSLKSYEDFVRNYPGNPYSAQAQDSVYALTTKNRTVFEYQKFIRTYSNNINVPQAWRDLFEAYNYVRDTETLIKFKATYPEFPFQDELEKEILHSRRVMIPFERNGLYGFHDSATGELLVDAMFDEVLTFSEGLAAVIVGDCKDICLHGYIDKGGKLAIKAKYNEAGDFHNGFAIVGMGDCYKENCKYGFINRKGETVVPMEYDDAYPFSDGMALVKKEKTGYGYMDEKGRARIKLQYEDAGNFSGGLAAVQVGGKWGFIDKTGELKINPTFKNAGQFGEGLAPVEDETTGLWGFIDATGNFVIKPAFSYALPFKQGTAKVVVMEKTKGVLMQKEKMIDKLGKFVTETK